MAQRKTWRVEVSGGIDARYTVLGETPLEAAQRGWRLDSGHQDHAQRASLHVQVDGTFDDVEDDIPPTSEDQLRDAITSLTARVASLESRVSSASTR